MLITFNYDVQFELCALLFLIILTFRFFAMRRFPNAKNKLFGTVLIFALANLTLDIIGAYTIFYASVVPVSVNYIINTLFYALQVLMPVLMVQYVLVCAEQSHEALRAYRWLFIPSLLCLLALAVNPLTEWIFHVPVIDGARVYARGPYFFTFYLGTLFYLGTTLVLVYILRGKLDSKHRRSIVSFVLIILASVVLQYLFPRYLLTGVALVIAIQMMFFQLQNPEDMLDLICGVFNYNALMIYLDAAIARRERLWLAAVDVGGIRRVNSSFGLTIGNQIIAQVGDFFNDMGEDVWAFRMMGTRFLISAPSRDKLLGVINETGARFDREWVIEDGELLLSATVRFFDDAGVFRSTEEVIALIDAAYSDSLAVDWGQCRRIGPDVLELCRRRTAMEDAIRDALNSGEGFSLWYQPIYHVATGKFDHAEALLRLMSPAYGPISPADFIPAAEKTGLIMLIDDLVITMASEFMSRCTELECLEINLSAAEFFRNPADHIHRLVSAAGAEPTRICFEVTETATLSHREMLTNFMRDMIREGYIFALDDFGSGYANVTQMASLPFSLAKLDRVLLADNEKSRALFDSIVRMFPRISVATVTEGVETREELDRAMAAGTDYIQGFYYAKPMPEKEFLEFLREHNK